MRKLLQSQGASGPVPAPLENSIHLFTDIQINLLALRLSLCGDAEMILGERQMLGTLVTRSETLLGELEERFSALVKQSKSVDFDKKASNPE